MKKIAFNDFKNIFENLLLENINLNNKLGENPFLLLQNNLLRIKEDSEIKYIDILEKLYEYMIFILEKNESINLTAITDQKDFILKHILDSLAVQFILDKYIEKSDSKLKLIDIGTGGGFPLVPLHILNKNLSCYGLDSVNKKLNIIKQFYENINLIHGRAEMIAHDDNYRENFDISISRAVSNINNITRYMSGFVKNNGILICMKGNKENYDNTILKKYNLEIEKIISYNLSENNRTIYVFRKIGLLDKNLPEKKFKKYDKN